MFAPLKKSRRKCVPTKAVGGQNCLVTRPGTVPICWGTPAEEPKPLALRPATVVAPGIRRWFAAVLCRAGAY